MLRPKKILWPTDFSELSLLGARYARAFGALFSAEVHVIHVIAAPLSAEGAVTLPAEVPISVTDPQLVDSSRQALAELVAQHFAELPGVVHDAFFGYPWRGICDYAAKADIDLIVLATHGRTGLKHALIGSTAERVVQHSPCPVLTVKSSEKSFCPNE